MRAPGHVAPSRRAVAFGVVLALVALTILVRVLGLEYVFVGGDVVFPPADPQYHLRRALYTLTRFPDVLLFDPYINHPGGAAVPWPPLFDFTLGALGRLLGGRVHDLECVAAWAGPVCAGGTAVAVYATGVRLGSRRVGAVAALLFALLPISAVYTRIGNADHHAAVGMIGAWLLYTVVALADPAASRRGVVALAVLLFATRTAMLLTWHGSLLYLVPAEGLLLAVSVVTGRRALLAVQAASAAASGCVVALLLAVSPTPLGGVYSSIALSRLHVLALGGVVATTGGLLLAMRLGRARSVATRLGWSTCAALGFASLLVLLPGPREGLVPALRFLTMGDEVGAITGEQTPLFGFGNRLRGPSAVQSWGLFAYLLPLAPLAVLAARLRGRAWGDGVAKVRPGEWVLAGWGAMFCLLAVMQRRYGNDAAPVAALLFATALVAGADALIARVHGPRLVGRLGGVLAAAVVGALLAPPVATIDLPRARASVAALGSGGPRSPLVERSIAYTIHRFAGQVRAVTPETSGFLDGSAGPEYGVIAHPNLGHALQYRARRATATDPFWWYIGRENWDRTFAFLEARGESEALEIARALAARYVVTMPGLGDETLVGRLHARDGAAERHRPALGHFRLITEAAPGGQSIGALFDADVASTIPYKLFEIVPGAVIEVAAAPGAFASATVTIRTPTGRSFRHRIRSRAGADGVARLRVPYATKPDGAAGAGQEGAGQEGAAIARALGPWRVEVGSTVYRVDVPEARVRDGGVLVVPAPNPVPSAALREGAARITRS